MFFFNLHSKFSIWFILSYIAICHFCFFIYKLNFNYRLCKMAVDIIIHIKIFCNFFIISFYIVLYLNDKSYYQIYYPIKIHFFVIYVLTCLMLSAIIFVKFELKTSLVNGVKKTNCVKGLVEPNVN
jgi:hypothetical protein